MQIVVENIEESLVRVELEDGSMTDLPRQWLPKAIRVGSWIVVKANGKGKVEFKLDAQATEKARGEAQALLDKINRKGAGGEGVIKL
jgi:hypothetical protein